MYFLYAIGNEEDLVAPFDKCYIGVTNNLRKRWKYHEKSPYYVGKSIRKYMWNYVANMKVVDNGTSDHCFNRERNFRPLPSMGLNEAAGGRGGKLVVCTEEHRAKISKALAGRKVTWGAAMSAAKQKSRPHDGSKNYQAKKWTLQTPNGAIDHVHGNLQSVCDGLGLNMAALKWHLNATVPPPSSKFRAKSEESLISRLNTTGWKLSVRSKED